MINIKSNYTIAFNAFLYSLVNPHSTTHALKATARTLIFTLLPSKPSCPLCPRISTLIVADIEPVVFLYGLVDTHSKRITTCRIGHPHVFAQIYMKFISNGNLHLRFVRGLQESGNVTPYPTSALITSTYSYKIHFEIGTPFEKGQLSKAIDDPSWKPKAAFAGSHMVDACMPCLQKVDNRCH